MIPFALVVALALADPADKPKADPPKPPTLDERIAAALKASPDVKLAEAKRLTAEAELEQARLLVAQKVTAAVLKVELAKLKVDTAEANVAIAERIERGFGGGGGGGAPVGDRAAYTNAKPALAAAKAELAAAEADLKLLLGSPAKADAKPSEQPKAVPASGPVAEKLEAAVLRSYKLDFKDMEVKKAFGGLMTAARLDDVPVRGMKLLGGEYLTSPPKFDTLTGQNTLDGWVQLFVDELNGNQKGLTDELKGKYDVYVREYGLLVERAEMAPKDAVTLSEFARAVRAKQR